MHGVTQAPVKSTFLADLRLDAFRRFRACGARVVIR